MREAQRPGPRERVPDVGPALWNRYAELRSQGNTEIDDEQFEQIIDCEMLLSTITNPPIQRTFDPDAELKNIRALPREQRRAELENFKETLVRQRHAFMHCRLFIERSIEHNAEVSKDRLKKIGTFFSDRYGFSDFAQSAMYDAIDAYTAQHEKNRTFYAEHPDAAEMVQQLSGVTPDAHSTRIAEGPVSIDIVTNRPTAERIRTRNGAEERPQSMRFQGFQALDPVHGIYYTVVVDDAAHPEAVHIHEREHAKNRIFRQFFDLDTTENEVRLLHERAKNESDPLVRTELRKEELRIVRDQALDSAKDELTSMFRDATATYFPRMYATDGGSYDYLKESRDEYYQDPDYAELAHEILVGEYVDIIRTAIRAFEDLRRVGNRTNVEAIALLTDMPLEDWKNTVRYLNQHVYAHGGFTK